MAVQTWRVGQPSRPSGPEANHDWVPSVKAPPHYSADVLVGTAVSGELYGLEILGSYGYVQLLETPYCPAGYFAVVATGGPNSVSNVVGFRQSPDTNQQGLRQIPGADWTPYPIIGSYHLRSVRGGCAPARWSGVLPDHPIEYLYPTPHRRRSRRSGSEPAGGDPMNPGWLDPVIYAAGHLASIRTRPSSAGSPDRPAIPHLGPGPDPDPRLPRYRAVYAPISPPQSASDIEVGRDRPARHRRGVLDRRPVRRVDKRRRRRGGRLKRQGGVANSPVPGRTTGEADRPPVAVTECPGFPGPPPGRSSPCRSSPASSPGRRSCKKVPSHRVAGQPAWLPPGVCVAARGGS